MKVLVGLQSSLWCNLLPYSPVFIPSCYRNWQVYLFAAVISEELLYKGLGCEICPITTRRSWCWVAAWCHEKRSSRRLNLARGVICVASIISWMSLKLLFCLVISRWLWRCPYLVWGKLVYQIVMISTMWPYTFVMVNVWKCCDYEIRLHKWLRLTYWTCSVILLCAFVNTPLSQ